MRSYTKTPHLEHSRRRARSAQRYEAYLALNLLHSSTSSLSKVTHRAIKRFGVDCDFSSVSGDDLCKFISKIRLKKTTCYWICRLIRDITLPTKVHLVKAMVFPVVMYGCESWTVKKAERRRIDAFELRCWRRLLRVPWTARRSNQSILKEISPGISLEGMMLKLKPQYFGHLMQRVDSLEKILMLGGIGARRRRG